MREAEFEGQTKKKLGNKKVRGIVEELVTDALLNYFERHPQNLQKLLQKATAARAAAAAAKAARDFARAKQQSSSLHLTLLPGTERKKRNLKMHLVASFMELGKRPGVS
ncbi:DNA gyrase subunit B [Toxoplasma gondii VAND]|nr:DNA gyrase subunit B [Toxoplasma gondii VAND]